MSKFKTTTYGNEKTILKFPDHYVNLAVTVSDVGVAANADGKKIVPAGTILGGGFLSDDTIEAVPSSETVPAEGILFYDVDVTNGPESGAALIHGFVDLAKLPKAPAAEELAALKQITFLK